MILTSVDKVINTSNNAKYVGIGSVTLSILLILISVYSLIYLPAEFSESHFFSNFFLFLLISIIISFILLLYFSITMRIQQNSYGQQEYEKAGLKVKNIIDEFSNSYNKVLQQKVKIEKLQNDINSNIEEQAKIIDSYNQIKDISHSLFPFPKTITKNYIETLRDYLQRTESIFSSLIDFSILAQEKLRSLNITSSSNLSSAIIRATSTLSNIQFREERIRKLNDIISNFGISQLSVSEFIVKILAENLSILQDDLSLDSSELNSLQDTLLKKIDFISDDNLLFNIQKMLSTLQVQINEKYQWDENQFSKFVGIFQNSTNPDAIIQIINQLEKVQQLLSKYSGSSTSDFQNYFSNTTITTSKSQFLQLVNLCSKYGVVEDTYEFLTDGLIEIAQATNLTGDLQSDLQSLFAVNRSANADLQTIIDICVNIDPNVNASNLNSTFTNWISCFSAYNLDRISSQLFSNSAGTIDPKNFSNIFFSSIDSTIYKSLSAIDDFFQLPSNYAILMDIQNVSKTLEKQFVISSESLDDNPTHLINISNAAKINLLPSFISMIQNDFFDYYDNVTPISSSNVLQYITQLNNSIQDNFNNIISNSFSNIIKQFLTHPQYYINKSQYGYKMINSYMGGNFDFDSPISVEKIIYSIETLPNSFVSVSRNNINFLSLENNLKAMSIIKEIEEKINSCSANFKNKFIPSYCLNNNNLIHDINIITSALQALYSQL